MLEVALSAVDFIRFTWLNEDDDQDVEDDSEDDDSREDDEDVKYEDIRVIDVLPDALHAELAHEALGILKHHNVSDVNVTFRDDVNVTFRESVAMLSQGPALFGLASDLDARDAVVDNVSTPLNFSVSGLMTGMQGTLEFYLMVGSNTSVVTAHHVLFNYGEDNFKYRYIGLFEFPSSRYGEILTIPI
ncbi:hypothetical protein DENSPDRAFT_883650 [Dentipellis sp. KUC8613]|nr:hypothetical protein DENSPDRAFT_883650 [Dentipellis sp. KUC8613]